MRDFSHTAAYRMDVWSDTFFPGKIGLWLLVTTISRKVNQLNFPLHALATAKGIDSEIVLLTDHTGTVRYAGWYRRLMEMGRTLYTGFYMTDECPTATPRASRSCFRCRTVTHRDLAPRDR